MALPSIHSTVNPSDTNPLDKNGFVGVDPVYQNFANKTDKPLKSTEAKDEADDDEVKDEVPASGQQSSSGTVPVPAAGGGTQASA